MSQATVAPPAAADAAPLWFLGSLARVRLDGARTGGRLALIDLVLPRGAAPPLHSHPQDETLCILRGDVTAWVVEPADRAAAVPADWVTRYARRHAAGGVVFAAGGVPHAFRVESDTAHVLVASTPAGIEDMVRALAVPARWPWLPPPPEGPRVRPERLAAVEEATGMVRHGPPPPPPGTGVT